MKPVAQIRTKSNGMARWAIINSLLPGLNGRLSSGGLGLCSRFRAAVRPQVRPLGSCVPRSVQIPDQLQKGRELPGVIVLAGAQDDRGGHRPILERAVNDFIAAQGAGIVQERMADRQSRYERLLYENLPLDGWIVDVEATEADVDLALF